jgi:Predicted homoserine dehydrogenase
MYYQSLFKRPENNPVRACLLGAGEFGASYIFQAQTMPHMEVRAVCTRTVQRAVDAYAAAGIAPDKVKVCATAEEAQKAYADGFFVVVDAFDKIADLPLEALVENSGQPEVSAAAAELAIEKGMHVVMVSKETDSVVGSILAKKAQEKGLVYTTGDGDQPSMLIGLISWGRALGLKIVSAGKASEYDFLYDHDTQTLICEGQKQSFPCPGMSDQWNLGDRKAQDVMDARTAMLGALSFRSIPDLCEMVVVANATGMKPDKPTFNAPAARIGEMPDLFCPIEDGGLLEQTGTLDIFNCLRRPDEVSMAGGEFIIVECADEKSWDVLAAKGHPRSRNKKYAAVYIPQHLLGVETGTSVLAAAIMGHATGGDNIRPVCDLYGRAVRDLKKGHVLKMGGHHHTIDGVEGFIGDAQATGAGKPVPFYLFSHLTLVRDVAAGEVIRMEDVEIPASSALLRLRKEQDSAFGLG